MFYDHFSARSLLTKLGSVSGSTIIVLGDSVVPDPVPSGDVYLGGSRCDMLAGSHWVLPRFGAR